MKDLAFASSDANLLQLLRSADCLGSRMFKSGERLSIPMSQCDLRGLLGEVAWRLYP
jgi:hypothetical protein